MTLPEDFKPRSGVIIHELFCSYMWVEGDIVFIYPKPGMNQNIEAAKEQTKLFNETILEKGKQYALICDIRGSEPIDKETRDYYSTDEISFNLNSFSFIVDSKFSRVIANFFIGIKTLNVKVKMFNSTSQAIKWSTSLNTLETK